MHYTLSQALVSVTFILLCCLRGYALQKATPEREFQINAHGTLEMAVDMEGKPALGHLISDANNFQLTGTGILKIDGDVTRTKAGIYTVGVNQGPTFAYNPSNKLGIAYSSFSTESNSSEVIYQGPLATSSPATTSAVDASAQGNVTLRFGQDGTPYIAYFGLNDQKQMDVRVALWTGSSWLKRIIEPAPLISHTSNISMAIDPRNGEVYVAYVAWNLNLSFMRFQLVKLDRLGNIISSQTVENGDRLGSMIAGYMSQMAVDGNGNLHLVYINLDNNTQIKYYNGSASMLMGNFEVSNVSVAVDSFNVPYISFGYFDNGQQKDLGIILRRTESGNWETIYAGEGSNFTIAIGKKPVLHLGYYGTSSGAIYYRSMCLPLPVQVFKQNNGMPNNWHDSHYAHSIPTMTIAQKGCALTSMAMVLKYNGYDTDPGQLNTFLKNYYHDINGNGIYDRAEPFGNGIWNPGEPLTDLNGNGAWDRGEPFTDFHEFVCGEKLPGAGFDDLDGDGIWDREELSYGYTCYSEIWWTAATAFTLGNIQLKKFYQASKKDLPKEAEKDICGGHPAIIHVPTFGTNSTAPGHYVVAKNVTETTFDINDPGPNQSTLAAYNGTMAHLITLGPPGTGIIEIRAPMEVHLTITDSLGRVAGYSQDSDAVEIPGSGYGFESIDDLGQPGDARGRKRILFIPRPINGPYQLVVNGLAEGFVDVLIQKYNVKDLPQLQQHISLNASPNSSHHFQFRYLNAVENVNGNGSIDAEDLELIKKNFGKSRGMPGFNPIADPNGDGISDSSDLFHVPSPTDTTVPSIQPIIQGDIGNNGWYTGNVFVSWTVGDMESGINSTQGCQDTTLTNEGEGISIECSVVNGAGLRIFRKIILNIDKHPPEIFQITPSKQFIWPPNNKMIPLSLMVDAKDNYSSHPVCKIQSVTVIDPYKSHNKPGSKDWAITGALELELRATAKPGRHARTYSILVGCIDDAGNRTSGIAKIFVHHIRQKVKSNRR